MTNLKKKKGITLIELVIALGLIGIITALVFSFFFSNKKTLSIVEVKSDLQYEAKVIMNDISKYAMEAKRVEYAAGNNTITFVSLDDSKIVFTINGGSSSESENKVIIEGNSISRGDGSVSKAVLSDNFKKISLHGANDKNINVNLTLVKNGIEYSVADSFLFRNRE